MLREMIGLCSHGLTEVGLVLTGAPLGEKNSERGHAVHFSKRPGAALFLAFWSRAAGLKRR